MALDSLEDIDKLKRLAQEFKAELTALGARIDNLEMRTAYLEDYQFSTTTKLSREVVMALSGIAGGKKTMALRPWPKFPPLVIVPVWN